VPRIQGILAHHLRGSVQKSRVGRVESHVDECQIAATEGRERGGSPARRSERQRELDLVEASKSPTSILREVSAAVPSRLAGSGRESSGRSAAGRNGRDNGRKRSSL